MNDSLMVVSAAGKNFSLLLEDIAEVVEDAALFPVPMAPPYLAEAINFHGDVVPVADLPLFRGEGATSGKTVVVLDRQIGNLGIRVDRVVDMIVEKSGTEEGETPEVPEQRMDVAGDAVLLSAAEIVKELEIRLGHGRE